MTAENLYVHFPFCRQKCSYCALYSRAGVSQGDCDAYARRLADEFDKISRSAFVKLKTVYFGGGTPALCNLKPLLNAIRPFLDARAEFTVELHPLDVSEGLLKALRDGGVNRISMGVQSLDDAVLAEMGRGYTADEAERAFARVKSLFDNAGIDLIVGYPGDVMEARGGPSSLQRLSDWGLRHCSVYSLQNERGLKGVPDDDLVLDWIAKAASHLKRLGLERYEISNYAAPGCECRHNLAVWRGEDYIGLGDGACGRIGLARTKSGKTETVTAEFDEKERKLFRLRTRDGLETTGHPEWGRALQKHVVTGLLTQSGPVYRLTERGMEVCDSILAELV